jgi:uncharacterized protein (DUF169 family)
VGECVEAVRRIESKFGGVWIPIRFLPESKENGSSLRFCEAVREAIRTRVILTSDSVTCAGARRSFGWAAGLDESLAESISEKQGVPLRAARAMVRGSAKLDRACAAVELRTTERPDVLVSFALPGDVMKVVRALETRIGGPVRQDLSSVLSFCGNVAARCHVSGEAAMSFGCGESRRVVGIRGDRLMIGLPWSVAKELLAEPVLAEVNL